MRIMSLHFLNIRQSRQNVVELTGAVIRPGYYDTGGSLKIKSINL